MATNTSDLKYFWKSVFEDVPTGAVPKIIFETNILCCFDCCALNWCRVKCFFFSISLSMVLKMNFVSNCCFVKIIKQNCRY